VGRESITQLISQPRCTWCADAVRCRWCPTVTRVWHICSRTTLTAKAKCEWSFAWTPVRMSTTKLSYVNSCAL